MSIRFYMHKNITPLDQDIFWYYADALHVLISMSAFCNIPNG